MNDRAFNYVHKCCPLSLTPTSSQSQFLEKGEKNTVVLFISLRPTMTEWKNGWIDIWMDRYMDGWVCGWMRNPSKISKWVSAVALTHALAHSLTYLLGLSLTHSSLTHSLSLAHSLPVSQPLWVGFWFWDAPSPFPPSGTTPFLCAPFTLTCCRCGNVCFERAPIYAFTSNFKAKPPNWFSLHI